MMLLPMNIIKLVNKTRSYSRYENRVFSSINVHQLSILATCYRVCKKFDECREYLMKAADCYKENRSLFHAARCFEQVNCFKLFFTQLFTLNRIITFTRLIIFGTDYFGSQRASEI